MREMLEKTRNEMLKEYFYDLRGCYPPEGFTRELIISILLKDMEGK